MKKLSNTKVSTELKSQSVTELKRKQWHGPYFASMRLELMKNRKGCIYEGEYLLNTKPLQLDMLAQMKSEFTWILDEITGGFRRHNIIEFKSPDDELNLDVFYKTIGYGCLYKAQESRVGEISETEIAITFIRERKPEKLLKELNNRYGVKQSAPGIYRINSRNLLFPTQILVLREMEWQNHIWVTALQRKILPEHAKMLVREMNKLQYPDEKEWADAVLQLVMANNKEIFEKMKEEDGMCQALRELMADEIREEMDEAESRGAKSLGEIIKRMLRGEEPDAIRASGANETLVKIAVGVLKNTI